VRLDPECVDRYAVGQEPVERLESWLGAGRRAGRRTR